MNDILSLLFPTLAVVVIIAAAYIVTRWVAKRRDFIVPGKIIKVVERAALGRDAYLLVVLVNSKPYLMSSSSGKIEILGELPEEAVTKEHSDGGDFISILNALTGKAASGRRNRTGKL